MNQDLGNKRQCPECQAKFYDLKAESVSCPKCKYDFPSIQEVPKPVAVATNSVACKKPEVDAEDDSMEADSMEELEGMETVAELEELEEFDGDVEHLREVEDHHEDPDVDINSDDAEDEMFIDELSDNGMHIVDDLDEDDDLDDLYELEDEERDAI